MRKTECSKLLCRLISDFRRLIIWKAYWSLSWINVLCTARSRLLEESGPSCLNICSFHGDRWHGVRAGCLHVTVVSPFNHLTHLARESFIERPVSRHVPNASRDSGVSYCIVLMSWWNWKRGHVWTAKGSLITSYSWNFNKVKMNWTGIWAQYAVAVLGAHWRFDGELVVVTSPGVDESFRICGMLETVSCCRH